MNLRVFYYAFTFVCELRENLKNFCIRKKLRFVPHPLNGQVDIQPIHEPFFNRPPFAVSGQRKIYLCMVFETFGTIPQKRILLNVVLDLQNFNLIAHAVSILDNKYTDILNYSGTASWGKQTTLAMDLLQRL